MTRNSNRTGPVSLEQELKVLYEISEMVQQSAIEPNSFEEILKKLGKVVDYRSASLFTISKNDSKLEEISTIGRRVDLIDFVKFDLGTGISAWVAKQQRPIMLNNLRKTKGGTHTRSFLSAPIVFVNETVGILNLAHDEPEAFTNRDVEIVGVLTSTLALLIERIDYQKELALKTEELLAKTTELEMAKKKLLSVQQVQNTNELVVTLNQKINNPLAIIAGNAQFLLMTMKNSSGSVLKRLKAIDKEAANILTITEQLRDFHAGHQIGKTNLEYSEIKRL